MTEKKFLLEDIEQMESSYRRNLMNSVEGFKNAALIGTQRDDGLANVAVFNSLVHIGATPPLIGFIHRPVTVPKQTYENIKGNGHFTINQISSLFFREAHQSSARYAPDQSEFEFTELEPLYTSSIKAPYVKQSRVRFGLTLEEEYHIKTNQTILLIGLVREMYVPVEAIETDGFVNHNKLETMAITGLDCYHLPEKVARLSYAKTDRKISELD